MSRLSLRCTFRRVTLLAAIATSAMPAHAQPLPYRDPARPIEERVRDLIGRMTRDEKFWQLYMTPVDLDDSTQNWSSGVFGIQVGPARDTIRAARAHAARIDSIQRYFVTRTRLGIPIIPFEEALHGLARPGATAYPQAIALAATWDTALVTRVATAIARETRSRGIRQILSPVVNLATDVRWGRTEETYGEDPLLSSRIGHSFVSALERAGIIATPKHFVANVGDGGRDSYPAEMNRRQLDTRHFPPFEATIVEAGGRSVMSAYNTVSGVPASQNRMLLTDVLRNEWKFGGFVISDAAATAGPVVLQHTESNSASAAQNAWEAGLDVIFQSTWAQHRPYLAAARSERIADSTLDRAVARVLRAKFALGLFENPFVNADSAEYWNGHASHRALAREVARASMVLLHNERSTLPLSRDIRSVALIGVDATEARLGGYSGPGNTPVSILAGLRNRLGDRVMFAEGPGRLSPSYVVIAPEHLSHVAGDGRSARGLRAEYWSAPSLEGAPRATHVDEKVDFLWTLGAPAQGIPLDWYAARWTGRITVPTTGAPLERIGVEGNDGWRLYIDDRLVIDNWRKRSYGVRLADVQLAPGSTHDIRLEYFETRGNARVKLVWDAGVGEPWRAKIDEAEALARRSAVAVIVAGIEEGEFRDRASLALPGHQEELVRRVAATGTPTVVVISGGSAVTMPWLDRVGAVLMSWYPGEEGGNAVTDVLFGDANPAARLPITFPIAEGQLPLVYDHEPTGRGDDYLDLTGRPLFPFGHGLSYTTFAYSGLVISPATIDATGSATVTVRVRNSGSRAGDEVVQLYLRDLVSSSARPVIQLRGFHRVRLAPGEEREVRFTLGPRELRWLDRSGRWIVEPGTFRVMIGASSEDIRVRGDLTVR